MAATAEPIKLPAPTIDLAPNTTVDTVVTKEISEKLVGAIGADVRQLTFYPNLHFKQTAGGYVAIFKKETKVKKTVMDTIKPPTIFMGLHIKTHEKLTPQYLEQVAKLLPQFVKNVIGDRKVNICCDVGPDPTKGVELWSPTMPSPTDNVGFYKDPRGGYLLAASVASPMDSSVRDAAIAADKTIDEYCRSSDYKAAISAGHRNAQALLTDLAVQMGLAPVVNLKVDTQAKVNDHAHGFDHVGQPLMVVPDITYTFNTLSPQDDGSVIYRDMVVNNPATDRVFVMSNDRKLTEFMLDRKKPEINFPVTTGSNNENGYAGVSDNFIVGTAALGRELNCMPRQLEVLSFYENK